VARFILICLGGALGTGARYLVTGWAPRLLGPAFPYGTLVCNLLGSFLMGLLMTLGLGAELLSPTTRLFLTTGALGGFTTYSSFNYETLELLQERDWLLLALQLGATVLGCLLFGFLGMALGGRLSGAAKA
jgi:CrcB protein